MEWESLRFQPYFTATASNVLFYWSHDVGGHRSTVCPSVTEPQEACKFNHTVAAYDPELYLRWIQWGAHSPILRTHPQPDPHVERRAWGYNLPVSEFMRAAFARRARLVPALFTANHDFETTAIAALRPLYYDWPDSPGAYEHTDSYLFVDGLLVAPVTSPQGNGTEIATRSLWLPPGSWVDTVSGVELSSPTPAGRFLNYSATLWEVPVFARSGTMLPLAPEPGESLACVDPALTHPIIGGAAREPALLTWEVWPGTAASGSGGAWEESRGWTNVSYVLSADGMTLQLRIVPSRPEIPRNHRFDLQNLPPPSGVAHCQSATNSPVSSSYDGRSAVISIHATAPSSIESLCLAVKFDAPLNSAAVTALRAVPYKSLRQRLHVIKQRFDNLNPRPGTFLMPVVAATNTAARIDALADAPRPMAAWGAELGSFMAKVAAAVASIEVWDTKQRGSQGAAMDSLTETSKSWLQSSGRL